MRSNSVLTVARMVHCSPAGRFERKCTSDVYRGLILRLEASKKPGAIYRMFLQSPEQAIGEGYGRGY